MKAQQVEQEQKSCERRVTLGLQMKRAGEEMIAQALREKLDKVGESPWLKWCEQNWGWSERTAYRHLDPEGMEKKREDDNARNAAARIGQVEPAPDPEPELPDPLETYTGVRESKEAARLAMRMVDLGFKRLAAEMHPDRGGTGDQMALLNDIRAEFTIFLHEEWA